MDKKAKEVIDNYYKDSTEGLYIPFLYDLHLSDGKPSGDTKCEEVKEKIDE